MSKLPLFPLHTVLFPGTPIHLNIFEERYRLMLQQCIKENLPFGVTLIKQGSEAMGPLATPYPVGCTARIMHLEPLADGRINLTAIGDERFRINGLNDQEPYLIGEVEFLDFNNTGTINLSEAVSRLKPWVRHYLSLLSRFEEDQYDLSRIEIPPDPLHMVYLSASLLQIPPVEKQSILSIVSLGELFDHMQRLYRRETAVLKYQLRYSNLDTNRVALQN